MIEAVVEDRCMRMLQTIDHVRESAKVWCKKPRGPFCRALEVYEAIWRYRDRDEVPLSAEALGLTSRHVPF